MIPFSTDSPASSTQRVVVAFDDPAIRNHLSLHTQSLLNRYLKDKSRIQRQQEVEDIVSETLRRGLQRLAQFDPARSELAAWMHGILVHVVSEYCRKLRQLPAQTLLECDTEATTVSRELDLDVMVFLTQLSPEDREIVERFYLQEWSHRQIAQHLGIPEGTARQRLRRALIKLRRLAAGEGNR